MQNYIAPTKESTCAVIVTFNPDISFRERLFKITRQFSSVVIVDNGSSNNLLKELGEQPSNVHLLNNQTNEGIASALNRGVKKAIDFGYHWFVTFDQDSEVDDQLLRSLNEIYCSIDNPAVIIGSNYWNVNKAGMAHCRKAKKSAFVEKRTVITSGMLFTKRLVEEVGAFRDDYFIDSVDHEFCLRARSRNYKVFISCMPLMKHSIGEVRKADGWFHRMVFSHSEDRVYYMTRNTIVTAKDYFGKEPSWSMRQIFRLTTELIAIVLKKDGRSSKVPAFIKGLKHGILGRMGPIRK